MKIGILTAMHSELDLIHQNMAVKKNKEIAGKLYHEGELMGKAIVTAFSHVGKVAATQTTTTLIESFKVDKIIFTGVAGGVSPKLQVGDIVVATQTVQHDMDVSALPNYSPFEVPIINKKFFSTEKNLTEKITAIIQKKIHGREKNIALTKIENQFNPPEKTLKVMSGLIASGDKFIANKTETRELLRKLPDLLCVEMEGAAVAQVCDSYNMPLAIIRIISDKADHSAAKEYGAFIEDIAKKILWEVMKETLKIL